MVSSPENKLGLVPLHQLGLVIYAQKAPDNISSVFDNKSDLSCTKY